MEKRPISPDVPRVAIQAREESGGRRRMRREAVLLPAFALSTAPDRQDGGAAAAFADRQKVAGKKSEPDWINVVFLFVVGRCVSGMREHA